MFRNALSVCGKKPQKAKFDSSLLFRWFESESRDLLERAIRSVTHLVLALRLKAAPNLELLEIQKTFSTALCSLSFTRKMVHLVLPLQDIRGPTLF